MSDIEVEEAPSAPELSTPNATEIVTSDPNPELADVLYADARQAGKVNSGGDRTFSEAEMKGIEDEFLARLEGIDAKEKHPYHNADHTREVLDRTKEILAFEPEIPAPEAQAAQFAALFHDFRHTGKTLRQAPDGLSNEQLASIIADHHAKAKGFSLSQRVLSRGIILGTTFGNPSIKPETRLERIVAMADIGGFRKPWDDWVEESARVLQEADPATRPKDLAAWLKGRKGFLTGFIRPRLEALPPAKQAWEKELKDKEDIVDRLIAGDTGPDLEAVRKHIEPLLQPAATT